MSKKLKRLCTPGQIGTMWLKNRMIMPAMGTNLGNADGTISDNIVNYYAKRAAGGIGLVITEVCSPEHEGICIPGEMEIGEIKFMPGLSRIPHAVHANGGKVALQLAHAGCFAIETLTGVRPKTPSGIGSLQVPDENPREISIEEIEDLITKYGIAAERGKRCGYDAIELHGAHGYLPLQFFSPYTNRRQDEYGGSNENRARFALNVIREIKRKTGDDYPLIYRMSGAEYVQDGFTTEMACELAKWVEEAGADAIHVSAGTWDARIQNFFDVMADKLNPDGLDLTEGIGTSVWVPNHYTRPGSLKHLAAEIKKHVSIPVIAVGSITPEMGEEILEKGEADFIAFGRQSIADPEFPNKIMEGRAEDIRVCLRCNECLAEVMANCGLLCAVNPEAGQEYEVYIENKKAVDAKRVAVVGGGPAGMQAAITASERGHQVDLFEKTDSLGGQLYYASIPDFKLEFKNYLNYLILTVEKSSVNIQYNTEVDLEFLKKENYDEVIVATGANPLIADVIEGNKEDILDPLAILDGKQAVSDNVIVCGGGLVGCEVALLLAEQGKQVKMLDLLDGIAPGMAIYSKWVLQARLKEAGVEIYPYHQITKMSKNKVEATNLKTSEGITLEAKDVICCLGMSSDRKLLDDLIEDGTLSFTPVGDVNKARKIMQATQEAYAAARLI
ncbi:MAG: FAD-dependent oxidoreductase [Clostridiaceae bacterium]|nr:FAD-dependent oxidoreductase [Clostridiaceae bacterium]